MAASRSLSSIRRESADRMSQGVAALSCYSKGECRSVLFRPLCSSLVFKLDKAPFRSPLGALFFLMTYGSTK